jgi:hypothetical protein
MRQYSFPISANSDVPEDVANGIVVVATAAALSLTEQLDPFTPDLDFPKGPGHDGEGVTPRGFGLG